MITTGEPLAADVAATIFCNGVRLANVSTVEFMQNMLVQSARQLQRNQIVTGLGCIEDPELLHSHLFMAILPGTLSTAERTNILNSPLNHGDSSLRVLMSFLRLNYGGINLINPNLASTLSTNIALRISSEEMYDEFLSLVLHLEINNVLQQDTVNNLRTSGRANLEWQDLHLDYIINFFQRDDKLVVMWNTN